MCGEAQPARAGVLPAQSNVRTARFCLTGSAEKTPESFLAYDWVAIFRSSPPDWRKKFPPHSYNLISAGASDSDLRAVVELLILCCPHFCCWCDVCIYLSACRGLLKVRSHTEQLSEEETNECQVPLRSSLKLSLRRVNILQLCKHWTGSLTTRGATAAAKHLKRKLTVPHHTWTTSAHCCFLSAKVFIWILYQSKSTRICVTFPCDCFVCAVGVSAACGRSCGDVTRWVWVVLGWFMVLTPHQSVIRCDVFMYNRHTNTACFTKANDSKKWDQCWCGKRKNTVNEKKTYFKEQQ